MSNANFPLTADAEFDDLPRTLRREKEARASQRRSDANSMDTGYGEPPSYLSRTAYADELVPATVRRFDVPFFTLVRFFLKAALAAIPALILLGAVGYAAGQIIAAYHPELLQMRVLISFPNG